MNAIVRYTGLLMLAMALGACAAKGPEMKTVDYVDIERFMGDWYVIASIPTFLEKGAHNALESYKLNPDGTIATTFTYLEDGFDGKRKEFHPKGFIRDTQSNAVWGMRFVWPIKADYRIVYLDEEYTQTVIGRNKRDFVWIMARSPQIPDEDYARLATYIQSLGYDISGLKKVPQRW